MSFNLDIAIFVGFLIVNLIFGLVSSKGIKDIKEYAIGDRKFNTATIAATIVATWMSGGIFSLYLSETYTQGIHFSIAIIADVVSFILIGYIFAPRMKEFLGQLSVAEAMGSMYGKNVRIITAITGLVGTIGPLAVQFKVSSDILSHFFEVSSIYSTIATATIIILYSSFGGLKAVTFTDLIQLFTFGTIIPLLGFTIWSTLDGYEQVTMVLQNNTIFDHTTLFDYHKSQFWVDVALFLYFLVPGFGPAIFQRITMAKNVEQVKNSFLIAALMLAIISIMICWIGVLIFVQNPNLDPAQLTNYLIDSYPYHGFKGFVIIGVISMVMSTADSYINSAAVLFSHDFCKPLKLINDNNKILVSRIFCVLIGVLALVLTFFAKRLLDLFLLGFGFYMSIVTVPFILAIFGFRTTQKPVIIAMSVGLITVLTWPYIGNPNIDSVIPGMLTNLIALILSHYLFYSGQRHPNGGVRAFINHKILNLFRKFNFIDFCKSNNPRQEYAYSLCGLFCIVSVFSDMYSIPKLIQAENYQILEFIYHSVLLSSTILLTYPIWPPVIKNEKLITLMWNILVPYILIFAPTLLVIISNFGQLQLMIFLLNMVIVALLLRWQSSLLVITMGVFLSIEFYKWYIGVDSIGSAINIELQFKILYLLLLFSSVLIAFIKPKQEQYALSEEKNEHLSGRIELQESELRHALALKKEFIRNVNHEYNAPMTGIISVAEAAYAYRNNLSKDELADAIDTIYKSALRLNNFDSNISTLAKLSRAEFELNKEQIDLSSLVLERAETCRKLYEDDQQEDRKFIFNIAKRVEVFADRYYLTQVLDNLIINAITYCQKGDIIIELERDKAKGEIKFTITDEGIGIPRGELYDIFDEFKVSSKTHTPAGGRGVGLAVVKKVIEAHGGKISADSDGEHGASFCFVLNLS